MILDLGHEAVESHIPFNNRREAENAAALAFTKLPATRRAKLLKGRTS